MNLLQFTDSLTDFLKYDGLTGIEDILYGFMHFEQGFRYYC